MPRPRTINRSRGGSSRCTQTLIGLGLLLGIMLVLGCRQEPPLESFGPAPAFSLVDQSGATFSSNDLNGRVALADFIYTRCTDTCPLLTARMTQVQEQVKTAGLFGDKVVLLSFSLDPEYDTAPVLKDYSERFRADAAGWKMLTGPTDVLGQVAQDFKLGRPIPMPPSDKNPAINLAHSNRFVLIDGSGQVRAYYPGEELNVDEVMRDIRRLVK